VVISGVIKTFYVVPLHSINNRGTVGDYFAYECGRTDLLDLLVQFACIQPYLTHRLTTISVRVAALNLVTMMQIFLTRN